MDIFGKRALFGPPHSWAAVNGIGMTELRSPGSLVLCVLRGTEGGNRAGKTLFFSDLFCTWPVTSHEPDQDSPTGRKERRRAGVNIFESSCCLGARTLCV